MELKSEAEELWLLRHPAWVRWLGWLVIPPLMIGGFYILLIPVIESEYELSLIASSVFLGGGSIYLCIKALKVFPYMSSDIEFGPSGFSIYSPNNNVSKFLWGDVLTLKHHASVQVLEIKNIDSKCILAITEQATSYAKFVEILVEKTGLEY